MNIMTKYGLYILLLFAGISQVNAQTYKSFKVDWGMGFAFGGSSSSTTSAPTGDVETTSTGIGGFMIFLEPRYGISDNLTVGLRYGAYLLGSGGGTEVSVGGKSATVAGSVSVSGVVSFLATADYYFSTSTVRPFGGLGVGLYSSETVGLGATYRADTGEEETVELEASSVSGLGVMPRFGVNFGHFKTILSYNLPFAEGVPKYLTFSVSIEFGGGRKKDKG